MHKAHALATATHRCLDHHWEADGLAYAYCLLGRIELVLGTRHYRHSCCNHVTTCLYLVAHVDHCLRIGADEDDAFFLATTCELGILAQESVTWVNSIYLVFLGHLEDLVDREITLTRRCRADTLCLIGIEHMTARAVGFAEHSHRADAHLIAGTHHSNSYLAAIGNKYFPDHNCIIKVLKG